MRPTYQHFHALLWLLRIGLQQDCLSMLVSTSRLCMFHARRYLEGVKWSSESARMNIFIMKKPPDSGVVLRGAASVECSSLACSGSVMPFLPFDSLIDVRTDLQ